MEPGTKVTWTHVGGYGVSVVLAERDGIVIESKDDFTTVKRPNGHVLRLRTCDLRVKGQKTSLTEFAETVFEGNRRGDK